MHVAVITGGMGGLGEFNKYKNACGRIPGRGNAFARQYKS